MAGSVLPALWGGSLFLAAHQPLLLKRQDMEASVSSCHRGIINTHVYFSLLVRKARSLERYNYLLRRQKCGIFMNLLELDFGFAWPQSSSPPELSLVELMCPGFATCPWRTLQHLGLAVLSQFCEGFTSHC